MRLALITDDRNPHAVDAGRELTQRYRIVDATEADVAVVLGGDGFMLRSLHRTLGMERSIPLYGLNCGTVGFLMNHYEAEGLVERVSEAEQTVLHPLETMVRDRDGGKRRMVAINEVALFRTSAQSSKIRIRVDGEVALEQLVGDGVIVATPAGSTAYNRSAGGPHRPARVQAPAADADCRLPPTWVAWCAVGFTGHSPPRGPRPPRAADDGDRGHA